MWQVTALTLFPDMFPGPLGYSLAGRALEEKLWSLDAVDIRKFGKGKHADVDDKPFGGGAGMVMRPDVLGDAVDSLKNVNKIIYMSPRGQVLNQAKTQEFLSYEHVAIICGRYEGIDQRVLDHYEVEEVSIGDYILSGGEIAALTMIDACVRQISGVLGNALTLKEESFGVGDQCDLLEYPLYTRPAEWEDKKVPSILLSGNHGEVDRWRLQQSEAITKERRPDLWARYQKD